MVEHIGGVTRFKLPFRDRIEGLADGCHVRGIGKRGDIGDDLKWFHS